MASESSSAVLDVNDDCDDGTEAPSIMDPQEGAPLIMEHGLDIAVKVDSPLKQLSTLETYVSYRVRCVCARWPTPPHVRRRYNHFRSLHRRLSSTWPLIAPPALPALHSARQHLDRYEPAFVAVRTIALDLFLSKVAKHPILTHSDDLRIFLTCPDDQIDRQLRSDAGGFNLWRIGTPAVTPDQNSGCRVKDPEFSSACDYLSSLQQKLTALCRLNDKLYKGSSGLSAEYMNMKRVTDSWSCQWQHRVPQAISHATRAASRSRPTRPALCGAYVTQRAVLPLLADSCNAHVEKIKQRDGFHAAYVAGNHSDELHNRLEQASEALRSELSAWIPQTRAEIKSLLLELADRQVRTHTQALQGWEEALRLSTDSSPAELFKTVSKSAVQNLSPSKQRPGSSMTDIDDMCSNDSDSKVHEDFRDDDSGSDVTRAAEPIATDSQPKEEDNNGFADVNLSS